MIMAKKDELNANAAVEQPIDIFSIGQHKAAMDGTMFRQKTENPLFDPKLKTVTDQLVFIVRPMPYIKNPLQSVVAKNFYAFQDGGGTIIFDSRTTFNRPAEQHWEFCPVSDLWLKFRGSSDPRIKGRTDWVRQQRANFCYVQIVAYPADPTMNGAIVPMRLPMEMVKLFDSMANPSDQDIALGTVPIQPFDIMNGVNIKCTIAGHMPDGKTLMRKWTVAKEGPACEAKFPLGPNQSMVEVSKLDRALVMQHFEDQQTIDLQDRYGYKEPSIDVKRRVKMMMMAWVSDVPGLPEVVAGYFPELAAAMPVDQNANGASMFAQPAPMAQQAMPAPQPLPTPAVGDPMNPNVAGATVAGINLP